MKEFQFEYVDSQKFEQQLSEVAAYVRTRPLSKLLFRFYFTADFIPLIDESLGLIEKMFPDAPYFGNETFGHIASGVLSQSPALINCSIFDDPDTNIEIISRSIDEVDNPTLPFAELWDICRAKNNLKAIELIPTFAFSNEFNLVANHVDLPDDVQIFGGISVNIDNPISGSIAFCKGRPISTDLCIAVFYQGANLHFKAYTVAGWHGLGKWLKVTKCHSNVIEEIDGMPAFRIYQKYLGVDRNSNFFTNQAWFPLVAEYNDHELIRSLMSINEDETISLLLPIRSGTKVRIAYGDHHQILSEAETRAAEVAAFCPQAIRLFSCASRRMFWGDDDISAETAIFQTIAPSEGFYTAGELLRIDGVLYDLNSTLVVVGLREGAADGQPGFLPSMNKAALEEALSARLVYFIGAVTKELNEQYDKTVEALNTDSLTGIANRYASDTYWKRLKSERLPENLYVISADLNSLKTTNDQYGHEAGDELIKGAATVMKQAFGPYGQVFRVGGDEFLAVITTNSIEDVLMRFREIMGAWRGASITELHLSIGCAGTAEFPGATVDELDRIADKRMYEDKDRYYRENHIDRRRR